MEGIVKRGEKFILRRRVPGRYASIEPRAYVKQSLATDSMEIAKVKAPRVWAQLIEAWEARLAGDTADAEARFAAAKDLAEARGYRFMGAAGVSRLPVQDLVARVQEVMASSPPGRPDLMAADALLGTVDRPPVTVSKALDRYWEIAQDKVRGKSEDQVRRWRNPRIKAVTNFIKLKGNMPIEDITTADLVEFRSWWLEKIEEEDLTPNSANKDMIHLTSTLKLVAHTDDLTLKFKTERLAIADDGAGHRKPFSAEWIRDKILAPGALDGLNAQARGILLGMINTGYRPSEAAGLLPEHIHLDAAVPYISIEPVGRQLKNRHSRRRIPLVGVSLQAFKDNPAGFPRYRENSATLSATVNKFLRENGLLETPDHSMYGLRHSFEDRMLAAGFDERIRRDLFGHALQRERYGDGATMEMQRDLLLKIAL